MMSIAAGTALAQLEVCEGKGYTLNSTAAAPPFGATSYTWYEDSNPLPDSNSASYSIVGGRTEGEYKYVRVASNAACPGGVPSNTFTVTVNPQPDPPVMAGSSSYCGSGTITATAGDGGTGILWDDGSTLTVRTVSTTGANTYRAVTTSAAGCTSSTATITVTIGQPAAAGSAPDATCGCAEGLANCSGRCQAVSGMAYWTTCSSYGFTYVSAVSYECTTSMTWNNANIFCNDRGMRLPSQQQLKCMCGASGTLPGGMDGGKHYWTSEGSGGTYYQVMLGDCDTTYAGTYGTYAYVKCVK
jgi:hypothetical protein